jgi:hypothetical protein
MRRSIMIATLLVGIPATGFAQSRDTLSAAQRRSACLQRYKPEFCNRTLAFTVDRVDQQALPHPNPQQQPQAAWSEQQQVLERYLFPPELIMKNQSRLQITPEQRALITSEISKLQAAVVQMQWGVADETQKLVEQLQRPSISEQQALAQVERLIELETAVKRAQLSMLIRIRNNLTPRQVEMLLAIRPP